MARMHSGAKGKSGSTPPASKENPSWIEYKPAEIEQVIFDLNNQGLTSSEIGMTLRDQYGVPSVKKLTGKTIEAILKAKGVEIDFPRDILNLIRKSVTLQRHMTGNKKDTTAKRGYQLTVSKIRRLTKYYDGKGKLPKGWRYTPEEAALLVK